MMQRVNSPMLVLDEIRSRKNIADMCDKARKYNLKFRPHFKTHQSQIVGEWFKEQGVEAITVSSIGMASYFVASGWREITIAFPVNINRVDELNDLAKKVKLNILISDLDVVERLDQLLQFSLNGYIEIDSGSNRSGVHYRKHKEIQKIAAAIEASEKINLLGCYSHAGHTYGARSVSEIKAIATEAMANFTTVKMALTKYPRHEFCWGDTPSCSVMDEFDDIDAMSAGNFVFYDVMQKQIGACNYDQVAVAMYCPVVSKKEDTNELCIHGGAVHFSKDQVVIEGQTEFGLLVDENWKPIIGSHVRALSQEHGMLTVPEEFFKETKIGDYVIILPVHSCLSAQAMGQYYAKDGHLIDHYAQKNRPE